MEMNETMFVNVICNCTLSLGFPSSRSDSASTLPHLLIHKFSISKNKSYKASTQRARDDVKYKDAGEHRTCHQSPPYKWTNLLEISR